MVNDSTALREQAKTVFLMYLGYAFFMVLKTGPIAAGPALFEDPDVEITKTQWGQIMAWGTFGGILGKFITGWMADRFGGKFTFTLGLLITSLGVGFFGLSSYAWLFGFTFALAVLAKSSGWPAMAKLIANWFQPKQYGRVWGILSTSSRVGTIIATLALGALLHWLSWRWMLGIAAISGILVVLICLFFLKDHPKEKTQSAEAAQKKEEHALDDKTLLDSILFFSKSLRFWLIIGSLSGLTILWDFLNFVPIYLKETLDISAAGAAMAASAFPVGSFFSVLISGYFYDKLKRSKIAIVMGILLIIATLCIFTFYLMPSFDLAKQSAVNLSLALLFTFGFCVSPCYYLPMSVFSIEFGGVRSGFLIALLDGLAFGASMIFSYIGGAIADSAGGWDLFLMVLTGISIWCVLTTFFFLIGEARVLKKAGIE